MERISDAEQAECVMLHANLLSTIEGHQPSYERKAG